MSDVKIKVVWDDQKALAGVKNFEQVSSQSLRNQAIAAKNAAAAQLDMARAAELQGKAAIATAQANKAAADALLLEAKANATLEAAIGVTTAAHKGSSAAALTEAQAMEVLSRANLNEAKAAEIAGRAKAGQAAASLSNTKAAQSEAAAFELLSRAELNAAKTAESNARAANLEAEAAKKATAAARERTTATERLAAAADRQAAAEQRAAVAAENRQQRDEGFAIRQAQSIARDGERAQGSFTRKAAQGATNLGGALSVGVTLPFAAFGVEAVKQAGDLEQQLDVLQTTTKATDQQMKAVKDTAITLGDDLTLPATSALDAARAMTVLTQKSLDVNQAMAAGKGTLQLAAAAHIDAAKAAEYEGSALTAFAMDGSRATEVADAFAASISASGISIDANAEALKEVSAEARIAKVSFADVETSINMLGKAGVVGREAGTALKTALTFLTAPTDAAKKALRDYGIAIYDTQGHLLPYRKIIENITAATRNMSDEEKNATFRTLFGTEAIKAGTFVLAQGTDAFDKMSEKVNKQGAAAELAAAQNKGIKGAVDALDSAVDTFMQQSADPFLKVLASVTREAGEAVNWLGGLPEPVRNFGIAAGMAAAALGPLLYAGGSVVKMVLDIKGALADLEAARTAKNLADSLKAIGEGAEENSGKVAKMSTALEGVKDLLLAPIGAGTVGSMVMKGGVITIAVAIAGYLIKKDIDVVGDTNRELAKAAQGDAAAQATAKSMQNSPNPINRLRGLSAETSLVITNIQSEIDTKQGLIDSDHGVTNPDFIKSLQDRVDSLKRDLAGQQASQAAIDKALKDAILAGGKASKSVAAIVAQSGAHPAVLDEMLRKAGGEDSVRGIEHDFRMVKDATGDLHKEILQCGSAISQASRSVGQAFNVTALARAASSDPKRRVSPNGVDAAGNPRYPNGTIIFFPGAKGGFDQSDQHFVQTYIDQKGIQRAVENTQAGGGGYHYRSDQALATIAGNHHYGSVAFAVPAAHGQVGKTPDEAQGNIAKNIADEEMQKAGISADAAKAAFERTKQMYEETNDLHYLHSAESIRKTVLANDIKEAAGKRDAANAMPKSDTKLNDLVFQREVARYQEQSRNDIHALELKINSSAVQREKAALDLAVAVQQKKLTDADEVVTRLEKLARDSSDPKVLSALQNAYGTQATAKSNVLRAQSASDLFDIPNTPGNATKRRAMQISEQNDELKISQDLQRAIVALEERRAQVGERLITTAKEQNTAQRGVLDAQLAAATTAAAQESIRAAIHNNRLQELNLDRSSAITKLNGQYNPLWMAEPAGSPARRNIQAEQARLAGGINSNYQAQVNAENIAYSGQAIQSANEQTRQRAERLRTEAELTDDLNVKLALINQSFSLLIGVTHDAGEAALLAAQQQKQARDIQRDIDKRDADLSISRGILGRDPAAISAGLNKIRGLSMDANATADQRKGSRGDYTADLTSLVDQRVMTAHDAISRLYDPAYQQDMTPAELAAASGVAKQLLDMMLQQEYGVIDTIKNPKTRQQKLEQLAKSVGGDPLYQQAGIAQAAVMSIHSKADQSSKRSDEASQFISDISSAVGSSGGAIVHAILHPDNQHTIFQEFWKSLADAGENALASVLQKEITHGVENIVSAGYDAIFGGGRNSATTPAAAASQLAAQTAVSAATTAAGSAAGGAAGAAAGSAGAGAAAGAAGATAAKASAGGAFSSIGSIAPYLAAVMVLSNPQVEKAITDYISTAAQATATVIGSIGKSAATVIGAYAKGIAQIVNSTGKAIQSIGEGIGSATSGLGDGIGKAADGIGSGIGKVLSGITGANAMRVQTMNVAKMDHATVIQGGLPGVNGSVGTGSILGAVGGALFGSVGSAVGGFLGGILGFSGGGFPPTNTPFLVGENGPELMTSNHSSAIFDAQTTKSLLKGIQGGGYSPAAPNMAMIAGTVHKQNQTSGALLDAIEKMGDNGGGGNLTANIHNPVYQYPTDSDRENERLARAMRTSFAVKS